MTNDNLARLRDAVRDVHDFPIPGIVFKDITPVLADGELFRIAVGGFIEACEGRDVRKIVGIDARGFLFGAAVAHHMGLGFVPVRKKGKLPYTTKSVAYKLEYGEAIVEMHVDAIQPGEKVILIDDLLATGGTSAAAAKLIERMGGELLEAQFLIELEFLKGAAILEGIPHKSFLKF